MKILNIEKKTPSNVIMEKLSKKNTKVGTSQVDIASYAALANELRKHALVLRMPQIYWEYLDHGSTLILEGEKKQLWFFYCMICFLGM